jgi:hypothetical protein
MKACVVSVIVVCTSLVPSFGFAQAPPTPNQIFVSCGRIERINQARKFGNFGLWMEYIVATSRDINVCPLTVSVEAHVPGVEFSGASNVGYFSASVNRQIPVPHPGGWESKGSHGFTFWLPAIPLPLPFSFDLPATADVVMIVSEEPQPDPVFDCEVLQGGRWLGNECALPNCPLIIDTARDGYRLTSVAEGVRFDLDADGVPEQVAWTRRNSDDAFLALDRNGNGRIDDGSELFGNHTPAYADRADVTTANGFEALRFTETSSYGASRRDRLIDAKDAVFSQLLLWRDRNHNGISEPEELEPVTDAGIVSIATDYRNRKRVDRYGNEFRQRAQIVWNGGISDYLFDIWLAWRD